MTDLATAEDVEQFVGRALTPEELSRLAPILTKLSELFRRESGQMFTLGISDVRVKVNAGRVYLPQRPVVDVASVTTDAGDPVRYARRKQWLTVSCDGFVNVEYMHGDDEVPELVRTTIADAARQVIGITPEAVSGVSQSGVTAGPYSEQKTYAVWAQGGAARLSPEDLAIARAFRVKVPTSWSSQPGMGPSVRIWGRP